MTRWHFFFIDYIEKSNQRKIVSYKWNGIISDNLVIKIINQFKNQIKWD